MKSTGEVLGIGRTRAEALFKGLTAAGLSVPSIHSTDKIGALISVDENDYGEIAFLAGRFYDLQISIYATSGTAATIQKMGIPVVSVANATESNEITDLMAQGKLNYIIYTGAVKDATVGDYTVLHRKAMQLGIPCITSLDTANALADVMASRFTTGNTGLVDINNM